MQDYFQNKTLIIFILIVCFSCITNNEGKLLVYLWDFKDCRQCSPVEYFIEEDEFYKMEKGLLKSREFTINEKDKLTALGRELIFDKFDSTYHKHMNIYNYMLNFYISLGNKSVSTSVYDSVLPQKLKPIHQYIKKISIKGKWKTYSDGPKELQDIWIYGLIDSEMDTILPSRESIFKIQKSFLSIDEEDWIESSESGNVKYELFFENIGEIPNLIDQIGITKDHKLFYEKNSKFYLTKFPYEIKIFPEYSPVLP